MILFKEPLSEFERTYAISSDNKAFQSGMGGYSIYGRSLDGADPCLRMEGLMAAERGGKDGDSGRFGERKRHRATIICPAREGRRALRALERQKYQWSKKFGCYNQLNTM